MKNKLLIIVFILVLIGPNLIWKGLDGKINKETTENRTLQSKPEFSLSTISSYPESFENYYNDHLAFKGQLVALKSSLNYKLFNNIESDKVLLGKDNWLYYKNETAEGIKSGELPIADYQGTNHYSAKEKKKILNNIKKVSRYLKKRDIDFSIMICPNKENIYSENLPESIKKVNSITKIDDLLDYLDGKITVPILYPKDELMQCKNDLQLYYKYDTHWNCLGGFIAEQEIRNLYKGEKESINDFHITEIENGAVADLAMMVHLENQFNDDDYYYVDGYKSDIELEVLEQSDDYFYKLYHSNATDHRRVMVIRDSYGEAFMDYLAKDFSDVVFIHRDEFELEDIDEFKPDIIIYQVVERATNRMKKMSSLFELNK